MSMRPIVIIAAGALALAACDRQSALDIAEADAAAEAELFAKEEAEARAAAEKNLTEGKGFLAQNANVQGMVTLPSGVQYRVVREGPAGGPNPTMSDAVTIHYEGRLIDGKVFDSSYERGEPATFPLQAVIPGWAEAVSKMKPGDEFEVYIPPEQGYGPTPKGEIPPNSVLVFKIELLGIRRG